VSDSLVFTKASRAIDRLQVASTLTGKGTTWYESKVFFTKSSGARGTFLDRVLVLPHKEGILFTLDPDLSASLAADGLNLYEIRAPGARPKKLGVTVGWNTVAIGSKGMFAFTDGPNRYAWLTKRVEICSAAREVCTPVPTPDGNISFDPSWSPNGKTLAFVDAPSKQVPNFCQSTLERWYAAHSLWLVKSAGSAPSRIRQAEGASVPIWSANGKSLLYEASDALWLLPTLSGRPVLVASPLFAPNDWPSYEGQIDWSDQFSWRSR